MFFASFTQIFAQKFKIKDRVQASDESSATDFMLRLLNKTINFFIEKFTNFSMDNIDVVYEQYMFITFLKQVGILKSKKAQIAMGKRV